MVYDIVQFSSRKFLFFKMNEVNYHWFWSTWCCLAMADWVVSITYLIYFA